MISSETKRCRYCRQDILTFLIYSIILIPQYHAFQLATTTAANRLSQHQADTSSARAFLIDPREWLARMKSPFPCVLLLEATDSIQDISDLCHDLSGLSCQGQYSHISTLSPPQPPLIPNPWVLATHIADIVTDILSRIYHHNALAKLAQIILRIISLREEGTGSIDALFGEDPTFDDFSKEDSFFRSSFVHYSVSSLVINHVYCHPEHILFHGLLLIIAIQDMTDSQQSPPPTHTTHRKEEPKTKIY